MLLEFALLVAFTFVLSRASVIAVEQAGRLSDYFGISRMVMGMLLVGVIASLPELSIAITSSVAGQGELTAGNVFGANVALILFALGMGAILYSFKVDRKSLEDVGFVLIISILVSVYIIYQTQIAERQIGLLDGIGLFIIFAWYAAKTVIDKVVRGKKGSTVITYQQVQGMPAARKKGKRHGAAIALFFAGSVLAVYVSANVVVGSAIGIASEFGLAQSFIGATFISLGTALPEMMMGLAAIRKKMYGIALGDAMGSVMANITLVLGTAAIIRPISLHLGVFGVALIFAVIANVVFFYFAAVKRKFGKAEGLLLCSFYVLYLITIVASQMGWL
ncbi:MAG: sodium:calcium antiporter [Candidatus Micrarchaeia archaeon]